MSCHDFDFLRFLGHQGRKNTFGSEKRVSHVTILLHTEVELLGDKGLQLVELNPPDPWLADPQERLQLKDGEVKVRAFCCSHNIIL